MHVGLILLSNHIGGTEKRFANLFNYLAKNSKHEYSLVLPGGLLGKLIQQDILQDSLPGLIRVFKRPPSSLFCKLPIQIFGFGVRGIDRLLYPLLVQELYSPRMMHHFHSFDVIHDAMSGIPAFPNRSLMTSRAFVLEAQGTGQTSKIKTDRVKLGILTQAFFNAASDRIAGRLGEEGVRPDRLFVSPGSFIDYGKTFVRDKEKLITFVGRMIPIKRPDLFVDVIERIARQRRDFRAYMLGTGPLDNQIDDSIVQKGLADLIIRQFHPHPAEVLSRSLIFGSLQQSDNYHSQALMEAMACGCAIIASDVGETWRLVSENVGFRVAPDPEEIAEKVNFLLDNPEEAVGMGISARQQVMKNHTVEAYACYLEDLYEKAYGAFHH